MATPSKNDIGWETNQDNGAAEFGDDAVLLEEAANAASSGLPLETHLYTVTHGSPPTKEPPPSKDASPVENKDMNRKETDGTVSAEEAAVPTESDNHVRMAEMTEDSPVNATTDSPPSAQKFPKKSKKKKTKKTTRKKAAPLVVELPPKPTVQATPTPKPKEMELPKSRPKVTKIVPPPVKSTTSTSSPQKKPNPGASPENRGPEPAQLPSPRIKPKVVATTAPVHTLMLSPPQSSTKKHPPASTSPGPLADAGVKYRPERVMTPRVLTQGRRTLVWSASKSPSASPGLGDIFSASNPASSGGITTTSGRKVKTKRGKKTTGHSTPTGTSSHRSPRASRQLAEHRPSTAPDAATARQRQRQRQAAAGGTGTLATPGQLRLSQLVSEERDSYATHADGSGANRTISALATYRRSAVGATASHRPTALLSARQRDRPRLASPQFGHHADPLRSARSRAAHIRYSVAMGKLSPTAQVAQQRVEERRVGPGHGHVLGSPLPPRPMPPPSLRANAAGLEDDADLGGIAATEPGPRVSQLEIPDDGTMPAILTSEAAQVDGASAHTPHQDADGETPATPSQPKNVPGGAASQIQQLDGQEEAISERGQPEVLKGLSIVDESSTAAERASTREATGAFEAAQRSLQRRDVATQGRGAKDEMTLRLLQEIRRILRLGAALAPAPAPTSTSAAPPTSHGAGAAAASSPPSGSPGSASASVRTSPQENIFVPSEHPTGEWFEQRPHITRPPEVDTNGLMVVDDGSFAGFRSGQVVRALANRLQSIHCGLQVDERGSGPRALNSIAKEGRDTIQAQQVQVETPEEKAARLIKEEQEQALKSLTNALHRSQKDHRLLEACFALVVEEASSESWQRGAVINVLNERSGEIFDTLLETATELKSRWNSAMDDEQTNQTITDATQAQRAVRELRRRMEEMARVAGSQARYIADLEEYTDQLRKSCADRNQQLDMAEEKQVALSKQLTQAKSMITDLRRDLKAQIDINRHSHTVST